MKSLNRQFNNNVLLLVLGVLINEEGFLFGES